jgi:hypothetical protein
LVLDQTYPVLRLEGPNVYQKILRGQVCTFTEFEGPKTYFSFKEASTELNFGQFNVPNGGENLLGSLKYRNEELYSVGKPMEEVFWLPVDSAWFKIAEGLKVRDTTIFQLYSKYGLMHRNTA